MSDENRDMTGEAEQTENKWGSNHPRTALTSRAVPGVTCGEFGVLRGRVCQKGDSTAGDSSLGISPTPDEWVPQRHS